MFETELFFRFANEDELFFSQSAPESRDWVDSPLTIVGRVVEDSLYSEQLEQLLASDRADLRLAALYTIAASGDKTYSKNVVRRVVAELSEGSVSHKLVALRAAQSLADKEFGGEILSGMEGLLRDDSSEVSERAWTALTAWNKKLEIWT